MIGLLLKAFYMNVEHTQLYSLNNRIECQVTFKNILTALVCNSKILKLVKSLLG